MLQNVKHRKKMRKQNQNLRKKIKTPKNQTNKTQDHKSSEVVFFIAFLLYYINLVAITNYKNNIKITI